MHVSCAIQAIKWNGEHLRMTEVRNLPKRRSLALNATALSILFVGYVFASVLPAFNSDEFKIIVRLSCALLLAWSLIIAGVINLKYLIAGIFVAAFAITSWSPLTVNIMFLILIAASLNQLDHEGLALSMLIPTGMVVVLHLLLLTSGVISTEVVHIAERERSSFGFPNPNQVSAIYFSFVAISTFSHFVFRSRLSFLLMLAANLVAFYIFIVSDSRTSLIGATLMAFFVLLNYFFSRNKIYKHLIYFFGSLAFISSAALTIYLIGYAGTELDVILSFRPYFFSEYLNGVTFWNVILGWNDPNELAVDNLYLLLLSAVGAIGFILVAAFVTKKIIGMRIIFMPLIFSMILTSIFESFLIRPEIPISVLFVTMLFSRVTQKPKSSGVSR